MIADGLNDSGDSDQDSQDDFNFRRIRWGDVFLQRQLYVDGPESDRSRLIRNPRRSCVRIVCSAKIDGHQSTVATYEGNSAGKEWKEDVVKYMEFRHESILQLYGTVRFRNICAAVFHGDFIPYKDFVKNYHHSAILTCYIDGYVAEEMDNYIHTKHGYGGFLSKWPDPDLALLINSSNGRLSVDLAAGPWDYFWGGILPDAVMVMGPLVLHPNPMKILASKDLSYIAKTMTLTDYHVWNDICWSNIARRYAVISPAATVHLGGIYCLSDNNSLVKVAAVPHRPSDGMETCIPRGYESTARSGGWSRRSLSTLNIMHPGNYLKYASYRVNSTEAWLGQANHIFGRLNVKSGFHNYVVVTDVSFGATLRCSRNRSRTPLNGFLFHWQGPEEELVTDAHPFKCPQPECCSYWSLCPSGVPPLSQEEATKLGFPTIRLVIGIRVKSWDEYVYVDLHDFHKASGFDPESQDIAVKLGEPLYELFSDQEPLIVKESCSWNPVLFEEPDCDSKLGTEDTSGATSKEDGDIFASEKMLTTWTSQSVSAWAESLLTLWDNQNWPTELFDTITVMPPVPAWDSEPSIHTSPFDFIDDPQYNGPSTSLKRRTEDNSEYESARSAKRARLEC
ncbi:hypothetical protein R3P38DRAFT_416938 [Favolaschia claudopus]|uniref:Uncharacterized protein n=1 Tax=Favolaschia claudopus TaxID=2862362 RepID=A0AAV9ZHP4_9AGAR